MTTENTDLRIPWPTPRRVAVWLASGLGLGFSPVAPGTVGCLWGIAISWLLKLTGSIVLESAGALAAFLVAIPLCTAAEKAFGKKDDRRIVADEYLTFPICLVGVDPTPVHIAVAFVINRLLDILKPPPARQAQGLPRGWGVVCDDLVSSVYTLALMHFLLRTALP